MKEWRNGTGRNRPGQDTNFFHRFPPVRLIDERAPQDYDPAGLRKYSDRGYRARVDPTSPPTRNIYVVLAALALTSIGVLRR